MKAVVMAGGNGTRLRPLLAPPINKHLMPVRGSPLIHHPLSLLARSGITEVLMLLNGPHPELLLETVGEGAYFGFEVLYRYHPQNDGQSVGKHLAMAQTWTKDEPFLLLLGDSYYSLSHIPDMTAALQPTHIWAIPKDGDWDSLEKYAAVPCAPEWLQTGLWLFDGQVYEAIAVLENDGGEIRIRDIVNHLHKQYGPLTFTKLPPRSFIDCGTPEAIARVNALPSQ